MRRRPGFTLLEILIAVMLTGLVTSLALAPVVVTVERVVEIQNAWAGDAALSRTLEFIGREAAGTLRLAQTAVIVEDHQTMMEEDDDVLIMMSSAPARQQMAVGSVVYRVDRGGLLGRSLPGLYRWLLPGKTPGEVKADTLQPEDGQLVLPGVTAFCVEVPRGSERGKEYRGALPVGLYLALARGSGEEVKRLEDVIVFP